MQILRSKGVQVAIIVTLVEYAVGDAGWSQEVRFTTFILEAEELLACAGIYDHERGSARNYC